MFEVTLGALLSIFLGAVLAAGYLMAQPVETVRSLPREPDPDKVYYVTGSSRSSLGKGWLRKKQSLLEEGATKIELSEDELNTWLGSSEMQADTEEEEEGILTTKKLNFRIADDTLQVGLPCELKLPGWQHSIVVQTRGGFTRDGDEFAYTPDEIMVGQLAAHRLPLIGGLVMNRLGALHDVPDELEEAWKTLNEVSVQGRRLVLVRQ
jgi:hypothetical protein